MVPYEKTKMASFVALLSNFPSLSRFSVKLICCNDIQLARNAWCLFKSIAISL